MPWVLTCGKVVFFAHVPKTGGSSVEEYLVRRFGPLTMVDRHKREKKHGTGLINSVTHLSALDLEEMIPPNADFVFSYVRDPLQRALSEYRWQKGSSKLSKVPFSIWLRVMVAAAKREPRVYDNHIRPQSDLVPSTASVFKLENGFSQLIEHLDALTGTTAPEIKVGHLKQRANSKREVLVTREDVELVTDFYSRDYERFGYATPEPKDYTAERASSLIRLMTTPLCQALVMKQRRNWVR